MAYFYVHDTASSTTSGGSATKLTGVFSAIDPTDVYGSKDLADTYGAADGDIICISHDHIFSSASAINMDGGASTACQVVSVDDANCENYLAGGTEITTGTANFAFNNLLSLTGITLKTNSLFSWTWAATQTVFHNSRLEVLAALKYIYLNADNCYLQLNNSIIDLAYSSACIKINAGSTFEMNGGSITSSISGSVADLFYQSFISGGGVARITGADLSIVSGYIVGGVGNIGTTDDMIDVTIDKCKMHASATFVEETLKNRSHRILITNSSSSSALAEYQYYFNSKGGIVEDATNIIRDNSTAFPVSNQKVSLNCTTDTYVTMGIPFEFDFPSTYAELSTATTDTLRIYLLSASTLTDADVWATAYYPDGTNKQFFNVVQSVTIPTNPLRIGGALSTNTEEWTGRTTENRYHIDLDTSASVGEDCVPKIVLSVAKASVTIYFDTSIGVV